MTTSTHAGRVDRPAAVRPAAVRPPVATAGLDLLDDARRALGEAAAATVPAERYATAHRAALRAAAAVLATRARPVRRQRKPRDAWSLLVEVAPELGEWAAFFAAGAGKRAAAEAGLTRAVSARDADDLLRDAECFLSLVETTLGVPAQPSLPRLAARLSCAP